MNRSAAATTLITTLVLAACGGGDGGAPAADAPAARTGEGGAATGGGPINSFVFTATGATPAAELPAAADLTLVGGCAAPSPMSIGFFRGTPTDDTYFQFQMESGAPVAQGHTGQVELANVVWDNGVEIPSSMPADSPVRVPSRLAGTGTLTIESHTGRGMGGRMSGTVSGTLTDGGAGEPVPIEVSFDINLACAG
jgi:hypothetical protein